MLRLLLALAGIATAQQRYQIDTNDNIRAAARDLAYQVMSYYHGNVSGNIIGILDGPPDSGRGEYYWWQAGALWGTMIDYWHLTGDDTYNNLVTQALLAQVGEHRNYQPRNWTASLGNDDQGFWGMSVMLAAEEKYPDPPPDQPQWLELAQAVWNTQQERIDYDTCGGGLRWQIPYGNRGFDYKNSIAQGIFFNMGARLAHYTDNKTYAEQAEIIYDWSTNIGLIDEEYNVWDGVHVGDNCTEVSMQPYSYSNAVFILGLAYMYDFTKDQKWRTRLDGFLNTTIATYFKNETAIEPQCELSQTCKTDMFTYKGYVHRWLSTATQIVPDLSDTILPLLRKSAQSCVNQCTGTEVGKICGFAWASGVNDGLYGAGQQMDALAAVSSLLIDSSKGPVANSTGGTSQGNPSAGIGTGSVIPELPRVTTGDKAGAGIVTVAILALATYSLWFICTGDTVREVARQK
ncbi:glycoside hydrolase family 76 protein [Xylariaceae sp. FL1019]|nr:glycoside hydrolase family 76 protein [Xylariaceae sp. FL1019]